MNKNDIKLTTILFMIILISIAIINLTKTKGDTAIVYYEDKEILKIDMNIDKEYTVKGYLGDVKIEVKDNKLRVLEEISPNHICSKEGYITDSTKSLVCLPNKIIIKITNAKEENIDGVIY